MTFLMTVLTIHFIIKSVVNSKSEKNNKADKTEGIDTKHPAEFLLR
jgi:hypothetical protein